MRTSLRAALVRGKAENMKCVAQVSAQALSEREGVLV